MAEDSDIDKKLDRIEAGARAGGAKPYLLDYLRDAKAEVFEALCDAPPTLDGLMRVWGVATGIRQMERDLEATIVEGREARISLNSGTGPAEAGQPD